MSDMLYVTECPLLTQSALPLMAMAMASVTTTRLTAMAMAGALSAAVSMAPLGIVGAKTPN